MKFAIRVYNVYNVNKNIRLQDPHSRSYSYYYYKLLNFFFSFLMDGWIALPSAPGTDCKHDSGSFQLPLSELRQRILRGESATI